MTGPAAEPERAGGADAAFDSVYFSASDGLRLHARDYGRRNEAARGHMPIVCLPGLTRNARDFHRFAAIFSGAAEDPAIRVVCLDYRGRGGSALDPNAANYNLATESEDVLTGLAALGIAKAIFVGTSRGGLIIHLLAAMRPTAIAAAVLNDAGPEIEGAGLAQIRGYLTRQPAPRTWADAVALLKQAHGHSFTALGDRDWAEMAEAIYVERKGKIAADYDPAIARQLAGIDFNTPLPTLWPQFDGLVHVPLMAIRGANSQLLSEKTLEAMKARHPAMVAVTVENQGHAPLLHTAGLPKAIAAFLAGAGL